MSWAPEKSGSFSKRLNQSQYFADRRRCDIDSRFSIPKTLGNWLSYCNEYMIMLILKSEKRASTILRNSRENPLLHATWLRVARSHE